MSGERRYFNYSARRLNRLTNISPRHQAVYLSVPKAGCSVVKRVLQYAEVDGEGYDPSASVHDRSRSPLAAPIADGFDLDELFGSSSSWFRFSFVRNPYTRALSGYLEKIAGEQWVRDAMLPKLGFDPHDEVAFAEFLRRISAQNPREMDPHWAPQHHLLSVRKVRYGFLGRFENLHADLERVIDILDLDIPQELVLDRTGHATGAGDRLGRFYDEEAIELVQRIYDKDFDTFGYGRDLRFSH